MVEKVNDSLNSIDRELSDINDGDKDKLSLWDSRLFNTWDWYSFLINEKRTTDKEIIDYFKKMQSYMTMRKNSCNMQPMKKEMILNNILNSRNYTRNSKKSSHTYPFKESLTMLTNLQQSFKTTFNLTPP